MYHLLGLHFLIFVRSSGIPYRTSWEAFPIPHHVTCNTKNKKPCLDVLNFCFQEGCGIGMIGSVSFSFSSFTLRATHGKPAKKRKEKSLPFESSLIWNIQIPIPQLHVRKGCLLRKSIPMHYFFFSFSLVYSPCPNTPYLVCNMWLGLQYTYFNKYIHVQSVKKKKKNTQKKKIKSNIFLLLLKCVTFFWTH